MGVFALPAILFFKSGSKEPVIYAGDLYDEQLILQWLLTQKDPSGDIIEAMEGEELIDIIENEDAVAVYFCKYVLLYTKQKILDINCLIICCSIALVKHR